MPRSEFSKATKLAAYDRSGGTCEATGKLYGLPPRMRCGRSIVNGAEYDHLNADSNGGDTSLENCRAVCTPCHRYKTSTIDAPRAAKTARIRAKRAGVSKKKRQWTPDPTKFVKVGFGKYERRTALDGEGK